ncbi:MAG: J domain-containing protein [Lachnospiraceae bacterium]|nr:J domain-containing protein [Lachnospiraceae bacterium]
MMINRTDVFQILEIEPTEDKKAIRKAYARLVKQYHPEEQPEKWKEIHDAYEAALHMAQHDILPHDPVGPEASTSDSAVDDAVGVVQDKPEDKPADASPEMTPNRQEQKEQEEMNALFERVNEIASGQLEQRRRRKKEVQDERTGQLIKIVTDLLEKEMFSQRTWSILLEQECIFPLLCSNEFLYAFGDCFQGKRIPADLYRYLRTQIVRIQNYDEERRIEASTSLWGEWNGIEEAVGYAAGKIDAAHYANIGKQVKERAKRRRREDLWVVPKAIILLLALMMFVFGIVLEFLI